MTEFELESLKNANLIITVLDGVDIFVAMDAICTAVIGIADYCNGRYDKKEISDTLRKMAEFIESDGGGEVLQ